MYLTQARCTYDPCLATEVVGILCRPRHFVLETLEAQARAASAAEAVEQGQARVLAAQPVHLLRAPICHGNIRIRHRKLPACSSGLAAAEAQRRQSFSVHRHEMMPDAEGCLHACAASWPQLSSLHGTNCSMATAEVDAPFFRCSRYRPSYNSKLASST